MKAHKQEGHMKNDYESRITRLEMISENINQTLSRIERRLEIIDERFYLLEKKIDSKFEILDKKIDSNFKFLITIFLGTFATTIGTLIKLFIG